MRRLILWDIDGTLVRCGDISLSVFDSALKAVVGRPPPRRIFMAGKTDPQIVAEYLDLLEIEPGSVDVAVVLGELGRALAAAADDIGHTGVVMPGIEAILTRIDTDPATVQTIVTGNIAPNAAVKLGALGLLRFFDLDTGAFGSDHADRRQLVGIAVARVAARFGRHFAPEEIWVVGDAPNDLVAARAAGARCLLVGTGRIPVADLAALGPDAVLPDLADTDALVELLAS
ncbi:MAG: HAD hydrolase-like protein [Actinomycetota bacterium]|jgi:phosphoglycolate phosphatase-like HAD superfamily hydrolase|nr:HAD hydrolase-like protein [Actinomycetota bacterium]